jgi:hypothetical protein
MNNMNYELAKKLKEAGFPLEFYMMTVCPPDAPEILPYPTLSELIRACKVNCRYFKLRIQENGTVIELPNHWDLQIKDTPEEAVAELWLVLNKK